MKERYYRIVWFDRALSDAQRDHANRMLSTASARIGTSFWSSRPLGKLPLSVRQRLLTNAECDAADPPTAPA